jgi:hypothetical protein
MGPSVWLKMYCQLFVKLHNIWIFYLVMDQVTLYVDKCD